MWSLWQVPACEEHGAAWAAEHPEWSRDAEPKPEPTWQELLDGMNPMARSIAEDMMRMDEEFFLYGNGPRPGDPGFEVGALMRGVLDGPLDLLHTLVSPSSFVPMIVEPGPEFPDAIGQLLHAALNPPQQDGPPYTHTFRHPLPEVALDDAGQPLRDERGEPVMVYPLSPSYTITRGPEYTGVLDYLKEQQ
jgi:hypothetical protein